MVETALSPIEQRYGSEVKDDLEKALENRGVRNLSFPEDIAEIDHWVCFRINIPQFSRRNDFPVKEDVKRIFLPMPANLGTQYTQSYNSESIGLFGQIGGAVGKDIADAIGGDFRGIKSIVDKIKGLNAKDFAGAAVYVGSQVAEEAAPVIGGAIGGVIGGPVGAFIAGAGSAAAGQFLKGAVAGNGIARNPYMAVLYDSPQFRTHQFSWKFLARSFRETESLREIIYAFKYYSAPGITANNPHFFTYPHQFDIDFHYDKYLFNIAPSVLTSFDVTYHSEGQPLYYDILGEEEDEILSDGRRRREKAPVSITISATFQEVSILTKDTINKQNR